MSQRNQENGSDGFLPEVAPLATPYVPFQPCNPPLYDAGKGIVSGTMFPGLDLPFMGCVNHKELPRTPLSELQTMAFAIQELALYLDTHRNDKEALQMYRAYQKIYTDGRKKYEREYGPLNHMSDDAETYRWLDDPWPWEYCSNREV